jgi:MFS superfamily sulfate permease-like transporter
MLPRPTLRPIKQMWGVRHLEPVEEDGTQPFLERSPARSSVGAASPLTPELGHPPAAPAAPLVACASRALERLATSAVITFMVIVMNFSFAGALASCSPLLAEAEPVFISACMLAQVSGCVVHWLCSTISFVIAGPYVSLANILAAVVTQTAADLREPAQRLPTALFTIAVFSVSSGVVQVLLSHPRIGLGRAASFLPLPFLLGLLLAIAFVLMVTGAQVAGGATLLVFSPVCPTRLLAPPADPAVARRAAVQAVCAVIIGVALWASSALVRKSRSLLVTTSVLAGSIGIFYAIGFGLLRMSAPELRALGWLGHDPGKVSALASVRELWMGLACGRVAWRYLFSQASPLQALPVYIIVHTMLVLSTLPVLTGLVHGTERLRVDADTEVRTAGLSSIVQGVLGCPSSAYLLTASWQHQDMRGDRWSGLLVSCLCALVWLFGARAAPAIPRFVFGALLFHFGLSIAASMIYRPGMVRADVCVLLVTALAYLVLGAMVGLVVGLCVTCADFVLQQSRVATQHLILSVDTTESPTSSPPDNSCSTLWPAGSSPPRGRFTVHMRLRGALFFASTPWLSAEVHRTTRAHSSVGTLTLDFEDVASVDLSAIECIVSLAAELGARGWILRCSGLRRRLAERFKKRGVQVVDRPSTPRLPAPAREDLVRTQPRGAAGGACASTDSVLSTARPADLAASAALCQPVRYVIANDSLDSLLDTCQCSTSASCEPCSSTTQPARSEGSGMLSSARGQARACSCAPSAAAPAELVASATSG